MHLGPRASIKHGNKKKPKNAENIFVQMANAGCFFSFHSGNVINKIMCRKQMLTFSITLFSSIFVFHFFLFSLALHFIYIIIVRASAMMIYSHRCETVKILHTKICCIHSAVHFIPFFDRSKTCKTNYVSLRLARFHFSHTFFRGDAKMMI